MDGQTIELRPQDFTKIFENRVNRKRGELIDAFWSCLRAKLMEKYSSLKVAFKSVDTNDDDTLQASEFNALLKDCGFDLDLRFVRALYTNGVKDAEEKIAILNVSSEQIGNRGGSNSMSYFMLRMLLLRSTFTRLRVAFSNLEISGANLRKHKNLAIDRLIFMTLTGRAWIAFRFQAKLTHNLITELATRLAAVSTSNIVSVAQNAPGIFSYHTRMMTSLAGIHRGILHRGQNEVSVREFFCLMILVSSQLPTDAKFPFIFSTFDVDGDGCVTKTELAELLVCLARLKAVASFDYTAMQAEATLRMATLQGQRFTSEVFRRLHIDETAAEATSNITRVELVEVLNMNSEVFPILHNLVPVADFAFRELTANSAPNSTAQLMSNPSLSACEEEAAKRMEMYVNGGSGSVAMAEDSFESSVKLDAEDESFFRKKPLKELRASALIGNGELEQVDILRVDEKQYLERMHILDFGRESQILKSRLVPVTQHCQVCDRPHAFDVRSDPIG